MLNSGSVLTSRQINFLQYRYVPSNEQSLMTAPREKIKTCDIHLLSSKIMIVHNKII